MTDQTPPLQPFEEVLETAHRMLESALSPGAVAVDATAGNGHDTVHLARCVGPDGLVVGFDVQQEALRAAGGRLADEGLLDRIVLLDAGHETMVDAVPKALKQHGRLSRATVDAVCFNLGYLPGGDKSLITRPKTTLRALDGALQLLAPFGVITAVLYGGHAGGDIERDAVIAWAEDLPTDAYDVIHYRFLNRPGSAELVGILSAA